jgi:hypothetical protein
MIVESKTLKTKTEIQEYMSSYSPKTVTAYRLANSQKINEVIDYERKKGTIRAIIILR